MTKHHAEQVAMEELRRIDLRQRRLNVVIRLFLNPFNLIGFYFYVSGSGLAQLTAWRFSLGFFDDYGIDWMSVTSLVAISIACLVVVFSVWKPSIASVVSAHLVLLAYWTWMFGAVLIVAASI